MNIPTDGILGSTLHDPAVLAAAAAVMTGLLKLVGMVVATLAGVLIKTQLNTENSTWKQKLAYRLVCYAEAKYAGNQDRWKYVADQLHAHFPAIDAQEVEHLIEEAVVQLQSSQSIQTVNIQANVTDATKGEPTK